MPPADRAGRNDIKIGEMWDEVCAYWGFAYWKKGAAIFF